MFRTKHSQPFAISAIGRIVKITKHIIPFNLGLENGAERCLAFEFVETSLHVADGIPHGEPVSACDAADGC